LAAARFFDATGFFGATRVFPTLDMARTGSRVI